MASVNPENVFEPHVLRDEDDLTEALNQLLQDVAREAFLILNDMQLTCGAITKKTSRYQNQLIVNKVLLANAKGELVNTLELIELYHDHIRKYHELLAAEVCSYKIPLWAYKQLRHQLVLRVVIDIRTIKRCVEGFSRLRERKKKKDFLMDRWHRELVNFAILET